MMRNDFLLDIAKRMLVSNDLVFLHSIGQTTQKAVCAVVIDRLASPMEMLKSTGATLRVDKRILASIPKFHSRQVPLVFFKPDLSDRDGFITKEDVAKEYAGMRLIPDPIALLEANRQHAELCRVLPNACQWPGKHGEWHSMVFQENSGRAQIEGHISNSVWFGNCWFAGIPDVDA